MKRSKLFTISFLPLSLLMSSVVFASNVSIPNTFSNGTPADADQVNANFSAVEAAVDDNDTRITDLESGTTIAADCGGSADALLDAINAASGIAAMVTINASGICNPVTITKSNLTINGPVTVQGSSLDEQTVLVRGATNVYLNNITVDGSALATAPLPAAASIDTLAIGPNAMVVADSVTVQNSDEVTVLVEAASSLVLLDNNTISTAANVSGLEVYGSSMAFVNGSNITIGSNSAHTAVQLGSNSAFDADGGRLTINGGVNVYQSSSAFLFDVDVSGLINVHASSLSMERDITNNTVGSIFISANSNANLLGTTVSGSTTVYNLSGLYADDSSSFASINADSSSVDLNNGIGVSGNYNAGSNAGLPQVITGFTPAINNAVGGTYTQWGDTCENLGIVGVDGQSQLLIDGYGACDDEDNDGIANIDDPTPFP